MNIVYTFDDGYSMITAVSILSLLESNKNSENLNLFIVDCGISSENRNKFLKLARDYNREIEFVKSVNLKEKFDIKLDTAYWSDVCYIRLFFAEMFPSLDKILHIDCDTIVRQDLRDIYNIDMKGKPCAACYDCVPTPKYSAGFKKEDPYYSNGFLLFDLNRIREENIEEKFINYIVLKDGKLPHLDQDVINAVLNNNICLLPQKYNIMTVTAMFGEKCCDFFEDCERYYDKEEVHKAVKNPAIVHLVGYRFVNRPWTQPCFHPYNDEWIRLYKSTPFYVGMGALSKKRYGLLKKCACYIWNVGYKCWIIRKLQFNLEKIRIRNKVLKLVDN